MMESIKFCPFCKSDSVTVQVCDGLAWVSCDQCNAEGPLVEDNKADETQLEAAAVKAWNQRA